MTEFRPEAPGVRDENEPVPLPLPTDPDDSDDRAAAPEEDVLPSGADDPTVHESG